MGDLETSPGSKRCARGGGTCQSPRTPETEAERLVVDSGEREYVLNDEMDEGCVEKDDEVAGNSDSEMEDGS